MLGMPVFPGRPERRGGEAGHVVPLPGATQLESLAADSAGAALVSRHRAAPSPRWSAGVGVRRPSARGGRGREGVRLGGR